MAQQSSHESSRHELSDSQQANYEIQRLRVALRESELSYRTTLNSMGDAIHVVDTDWRITFFNTAFTRWDEELGLPIEVVGQTLFEVFPFLSDEVLNEYEHVVESGEMLITEENISIGDQQFITETRKIPIIRNGQVHEVVTAIRNLTDIRRTEETLERTEGWLQGLSVDMLNAKEDERKRISVELHDRIGQILAAIKYRVETASAEMQDERHTAAVKTLEPVAEVIRSALSELRRIELDLQPPVLIESGLEAAVAQLCEEFESTCSGIQFEKSISLDEQQHPDFLKIAIYRIVQAALTNVALHSHADRVRISLTSSESTMELTINDNGTGFDVNDMLARAQSKRGLGLSSMNERATLSGGTFSIESGKGSGTTVRVIWNNKPE
jgi:PAS domain S-box-containing protein